VLTRHGRVTFRRGIWHCPRCGTGHAPFDEQAQVPPGNASWAVREGIALLGAWMPFRRAASTYERLTGLTVSARSAENWTEALGAAYAPPVLDRYGPGPVVDTLFVEADATMVWFDDGWHEVKTVVCWGRKDGEDLRARYLTGEGSWESLGERIHQLARRQGLRRAGQVVLLADGAPPIWKVFGRWLPRSLELLDWYHLQQHLAEVAALLPAGKEWQETQAAALAERGPAETLRAVAALAQGGATAAVRQTARRCLAYLQEHRQRLDYPRARALGYPIGSGRVESACGHVVQQRLKLAGMQWAHTHATAVLNVRCADLNDDWDHACQQLIAKAA